METGKKSDRGSILGTVAGLLLGMLACLLLVWLVGQLTPAGTVIMIPFIGIILIAAYRRCGGWKREPAACVTTGLAAMVTGLLCLWISEESVLGPKMWTPKERSDWERWRLVLLGLDLLCFWRNRGLLKAYTAQPELAPRYEANRYAGGTMYNMCPRQLPSRPVPQRFYVGGRITVEGDQLTTTPMFRRGSTFSVDQIAGVVLGPCSGSNVLYDRDFRTLAKFAWSMDSAELLALYLLEHQIPFDNLPDRLVPKA